MKFVNVVGTKQNILTLIYFICIIFYYKGKPKLIDKTQKLPSYLLLLNYENYLLFIIIKYFNSTFTRLK